MNKEQRRKELYEKLRGNSPTMETLAAIETQLNQEEAQEKQEQEKINEIVKQSFSQFHTETSPRYDPNISEIYRQIELEMDLKYKDFYKNMANRLEANLREKWETEVFSESKLLELLFKALMNDPEFIPRVDVLVEQAKSNLKAYQKRGR